MAAEYVADRSRNRRVPAISVQTKGRWGGVAMTRAELIEHIRAVVSRLGDDVGMERFLKETGISQYDLKIEGTWNELKREAGFRTRRFGQDRMPAEDVYDALARIVERDQAWPTGLGLMRERKKDKTIPSVHVFRRVRLERDFIANLLAYCSNRPEFSSVPAIVQAQPLVPDGDTVAESGARVLGYVYMMRYGRRYKVGRTNSPTRRHREVQLELPDPTTLVHSIETDDPSGIEAYWHGRFSAKRVRDTEFFELDGHDVAAFKRRRYM